MLKTEATMMVIADVGTRNEEPNLACRAEDSDETKHLKLFFVSAAVQKVPVLILADSLSVRNLIS